MTEEATQGEIDRYGLNSKRIDAFGAVTEAQARRKARETLRKELSQTRTVTFSIGAEGLLITPGMIVEIVDPLRNNTPLLYDVLSVTEARQGIEFQVSAVTYNPSIYTDIETGTGLVSPELFPPSTAPPPEQVTVTHGLTITSSNKGTITITSTN